MNHVFLHLMKFIALNIFCVAIEVTILILCFSGILAMSYGDLADNNYLVLIGVLLCQILLTILAYKYSSKENLNEYLKAILFIFIITAIWISVTIEIHYRFLITGF